MINILNALKTVIGDLAGLAAKGPRIEAVAIQLRAAASNLEAEIKAAAPPGAQASKPAASPATQPPAAGSAKSKAGYVRLGLLALLALVSLLLMVLAFHAQADSFNITNVLAQSSTAGPNLVGWPTNTPTSAGVGQNTGGVISMANDKEGLFWFSCLSLTNTNTCTWTIQAVRSISSPAQAVVLTNTVYGGTVYTLQQDTFETTPQITLTFTMPPLTNQMFLWCTNLSSTYLGECAGLGIYSITNWTTGGYSFFTNCQAGLNKKIVPIRYP
ncbi:MAG: hypothetical protein ACLQM8_22490 [Limisphaerales bacterium]